ncbi:hypothetical protein HYH03_004133 [Edaphochlamys debaryana]|uniref:RAP domain-containing protein n=1 Tax=Edaphochlamys debaryana TaxID=47281 RepID=A0A835Y7U1_9CHLO|nr:hypothetical protein HYH03_004133 [Edaphochlamys debaryana]|eukprot:KAG2497867.1 hypothetical protein HYH03_004133 [Edaphochlamys debaryana]
MRALLVGWLAGRGRGSAAATPAASTWLGSLSRETDELPAPAATVPWAAAGAQRGVLSPLFNAEGLLPTAAAAAVRGLAWGADRDWKKVANPIADIVACRDLRELRALVDSETAAWSSAGNAKAMCTAFNKASKLGTTQGADPVTNRRVFRTLAAAYLPLVEGRPDAAGCTIPLHACAKAGYWEGVLATALLQRLSADGGALLGTAQANEHANLWWSLSEADKSSEGRQVLSSINVSRLLDASAACLLASNDSGTRHSSNILLACARLRHHNAALTQHLTAHLADNGDQANCHDLANALYALGELAKDAEHEPQPRVVRGILKVVSSRLAAPGDDEFTAQALSNMLLGCFNLGSADSSLRDYALQLAEQLAQECQRRIFAGFNPQDFANTTWALAKMGYDEHRWYAAVVEATEQPGAMQEAIAQNWSNLWYALALVRHQPASGRLLERTVEAAGQLRSRAEPQHCANLLWALANLRLYDERPVDALAGRLGELLGQGPQQLTAQNLCNSLWALAVMGTGVLSRHSGLVEGLLREAERRWATDGSKGWTPERRAHLWQAYLEVEALTGNTPRSGPLLAAAQEAAVARATRLAAKTRPEALEEAVALTLQQLQAEGAIVSVQQRVVLEGLGRYAEALVERPDGRRVAVETIIPDDLLVSSPRPHELRGSTELRLRQLGREEGAGEVVRVPYWEWEIIKDEAGRKAYLRRLLGVGPA